MAVATARRFIEGPLSKWTNVVNGWQYRWFVLDQNSGLLSYYTSKDKMKRGSRRGCFRLKRAIIGIDDEDDCTFTIRVDNRTYHFQCQNSDEREQWVHSLESCIRRLHQPIRPIQLTLPDVQSGISLDQRMTEAETYYHILQEQIQDITQTFNTTEEAKQIKDTAKTMMEALRQCIDVMKDSQLVELGSPSIEPTPSPPSPVGIPAAAPLESKALEVAMGGVKGEIKSSPDLLRVKRTKNASSSSESSSTSEDSSDVDSDEFFDADAELETFDHVITSPSLSVPIPEGDPSDVEEDEEIIEEDNTSDGVQANKSVIMHMLSQVRVGMDLTRIVLPTFILEKRSLLEMYAEFLAHPDIFSDVPHHSDPKDRMIALVRFYLSSFHAARKGTVAKKPYNPILGETFHCYWDLPNSTRTPPSKEAEEIHASGPVPYASYNGITFAAEQVSHHPPISGFYAECANKNMYVTGSIWTKSKFLGLSLGVHNIGSVRLHLLDHNEVYTCNLPNAYGRSILTVPWLELGGKVNVECLQSGYGATLEFHCKPFYGGRKHRVTADIFHLSDKKAFMKIEGEWNGVMYVKHPNGDKEVFMDTLNTPTIRKKLRKLSAQDPAESRKRWQHVTTALTSKDVDAATDAKHALEEEQRAGARHRKETGEEWQQKLFHLEGDTWIYNHTLDKRRSELAKKMASS